MDLRSLFSGPCIKSAYNDLKKNKERRYPQLYEYLGAYHASAYCKEQVKVIRKKERTLKKNTLTPVMLIRIDCIQIRIRKI